MSKLTSLKSVCFLVKLSKKPITIAAEMVDDPPYDKNGNVMPFVGIIDKLLDMCINDWTPIKADKLDRLNIWKISLQLKAIIIGLKIIIV